MDARVGTDLIRDPNGNLIRRRYSDIGFFDDGRGVERWWQHINAQIYRIYRHRITGVVIDVGCGIGMVSLLIAKDPAVQWVSGVDVSYRAIAVAESYARQLAETKVTFDVVDFTRPVDIPRPTRFPSQTFDSAVSFHTLEHIYPEDLDTFMSNLYFVLKDGAPVLISIPYLKAYHDEGHHSIFDVESLTRLFVAHGFDAEEVYCTYEGRAVYGDNYDHKVLTGLFVKGG